MTRESLIIAACKTYAAAREKAKETYLAALDAAEAKYVSDCLLAASYDREITTQLDQTAKVHAIAAKAIA